MRKIVYLLVVILFLGCEKEEVKPTYLEPVGSWVNEIPSRRGISATYLTSSVIEDVLTFGGVYLIYSFENDGEQRAISSSNVQSNYHRNFFSSNFIFLKDYQSKYLQIYNESFFSPNRTIIQLPLIDSSFIDYNFEYELGAGSDDNVAIVSLAKDETQTNVHLVLFKIYNNEHYKAQIDTNFGYIQVELPVENDIKVHRMESDGVNFYITTTENSYRVEPNGDFQQIFDFPIREYFKYQNNWYADAGNAIYKSSDTGMSWELVADNLNYDGFRQFFEVENDLFFYYEDKVYNVTNISTFDYQELESRLLDGRKITSAIVYYDKVYLSTMNGIFSKPIDRLFEGL
jgi:hypothetical protein